MDKFNDHGKLVVGRSPVAKASGSKTQPGSHELKQVNDGANGNSRSWMSSETFRAINPTGWIT